MYDTPEDLKQRLSTAVQSGPDAGSSDFDLNPEMSLPQARKLRPAGVLVPISLASGAPRVILTKRSSALKHHPGQIAFPGGKVDEGDRDVTHTALREAWEEIGLPQDLPEVLGALPTHETVTSFTVTPVVALLRSEFDIRPEAGEVAEVFSVPLSHVLDPANYIIESRRWRGTRRRYYTVPYGPYYIWGATARMLRQFADRMQS
ncbi:MAG: CoA pyrophosphatase [Pseudophaeobacter sp. bin_em_oilr2.035]|uniref:CoA pyrophosphatase n=1 Tax=Phaeobacter gallaeciensis TaxID=60890 RepID=A0ABD4XA45_9RHOB|nr:CoA pyrophosphatase [Phaeobacter gallaeciensis]MDF1773722.1 CoA pyrophosphatase [Pseudophaeobacter sp. bin_em_oilr2.035]MDE4145156.1 CoA pyrophosphatase [Phaeobacter gallaeciensis]MDE4157826.1 CoA pyrophosphatase [Phaeobacter gallaeciensis]MDE4162007.1 CoA pyrophosphatase [Phaeobacter gallaeciensis]MDE4166230.1 CoA pyrophosphatase [Phaeobacter gallaeciensis]